MQSVKVNFAKLEALGVTKPFIQHWLKIHKVTDPVVLDNPELQQWWIIKKEARLLLSVVTSPFHISVPWFEDKEPDEDQLHECAAFFFKRISLRTWEELEQVSLDIKEAFKEYDCEYQMDQAVVRIDSKNWLTLYKEPYYGIYASNTSWHIEKDLNSITLLTELVFPAKVGHALQHSFAQQIVLYKRLYGTEPVIRQTAEKFPAGRSFTVAIGNPEGMSFITRFNVINYIDPDTLAIEPAIISVFKDFQ